MRLASLTPSNTEILAFLGRAHELVGVDTWSDWPPGLWDEDVIDLGPDLQIDVERLVELEPDLVLAAESVPGMEPVVDRVEAAGLETLVLAPTSLAEVLEDIERVAEAVGARPRGRMVLEAMQAGLDQVEGLTEDRDPPSVCWEWWPRPIIVAGGGGWMVDVVRLAGGKLCFADRTDQSLEVSAQEVAAEAPEVIGLCWQGTLHERQDPARVHGREGYERVPAVVQDRILTMPEALFGRPGPRLVEGVRLLAAELHPELDGALGEPYAWVSDDIHREIEL